MEDVRLTHFSGLPLHDGEFSVRLIPRKEPLSAIWGMAKTRVIKSGMTSTLLFDFPGYRGIESSPFAFFDPYGTQLVPNEGVAPKNFVTYEHYAVMGTPSLLGSETLVVLTRDRLGDPKKISIETLTAFRRADGADRLAVIEYSIPLGMIFLREMGKFTTRYGTSVESEAWGIIAKVAPRVYHILEADPVYSDIPRDTSLPLIDLYPKQRYAHKGVLVREQADFGLQASRSATSSLDGALIVLASHLIYELGDRLQLADLKNIPVESDNLLAYPTNLMEVPVLSPPPNKLLESPAE
jgi:hypothetical protein